MTGSLNAKEIFALAIDKHLQVVAELKFQQNVLKAIAVAVTAALRRGGKILICGNGGSAADSQHLAAEIVGRFRRERIGLPVIALTTDSSILTAIGNDYGYTCVFSRQVEALARPGDVLVGISTSGKSENVVTALNQARSMGAVTVAFTGAGGGKWARLRTSYSLFHRATRRGFRKRIFSQVTCYVTGSSLIGCNRQS